MYDRDYVELDAKIKKRCDELGVMAMGIGNQLLSLAEAKPKLSVVETIKLVELCSQQSNHILWLLAEFVDKKFAGFSTPVKKTDDKSGMKNKPWG